MAELQPCPFCESDKLKIEHKVSSVYKIELRCVEPYTFSVRCNKCHARGPTVFGYLRGGIRELSDAAALVMETREQLENRAIDAWNRRNDNQAKLLKDIDDLKRQIENLEREAELKWERDVMLEDTP